MGRITQQQGCQYSTYSCSPDKNSNPDGKSEPKPAPERKPAQKAAQKPATKPTTPKPPTEQTESEPSEYKTAETNPTPERSSRTMEDLAQQLMAAGTGANTAGKRIPKLQKKPNEPKKTADASKAKVSLEQNRTALRQCNGSPGALDCHREVLS